MHSETGEDTPPLFTTAHLLHNTPSFRDIHEDGRTTQTDVVLLAQKYFLLFSEAMQKKKQDLKQARVVTVSDTTDVNKPETPTRKSSKLIYNGHVANFTLYVFFRTQSASKRL